MSSAAEQGDQRRCSCEVFKCGFHVDGGGSIVTPNERMILTSVVKVVKKKRIVTNTRKNSILELRLSLPAIYPFEPMFFALLALPLDLERLDQSEAARRTKVLVRGKAVLSVEAYWLQSLKSSDTSVNCRRLWGPPLAT